MGLIIKTAAQISAEADQRNAERQQKAAKQYLDSTDWMVVRQAETGVSVPEEVASLRAQAREVWTQPQGAHDTYMTGDQVEVDGVVWESVMDFNVWEPGTTGWRQYVAEGYAPWQQPAGAHDAYELGDRVTHEGSVWESLQNGNVWEPGTVAGIWQEVEAP